MKTLLVTACFIGILSTSLIGQTSFDSREEIKLQGRSIASGTSDDEKSASLLEKAIAAYDFVETVGDIGTTSQKIRVLLGTITTNAEVVDQSGDTSKAKRKLPVYLDFSLEGRIAIDFDSLVSPAIEYVRSLRPSPATLNLNYQQYWTTKKSIDVDATQSVISSNLNASARFLPFLDSQQHLSSTGTVQLSGSLNLWFPASVMENDKVIDKGTWYLESYLLATGLFEAAVKSDILDESNVDVLSGLEFHVGYASFKDTKFDLGIIGNVLLNNVKQSQWRIGIQLSGFL